MATAARTRRFTPTGHDLRAWLRTTWARICVWALARPAWLALAVITAVAAALRLTPWLAVYPLHHDEALYGTWARLIATGQDPLLLTPWVDKPPLSIYLSAASFRLFGVSELALRLPGMIAGLLTIWATYCLALRLDGAACCAPGQVPASGFSRQRAALLAAALVALSPFAVLFAPTAFTDPWLALWLVVAAWAALAERSLIAGLAAGLAVASKQQGVLVIPLVLALLIGRGAGLRQTLRQAALAVLGFALVFGPLIWWDSLRWHNRPSFWDRSLATYGGLGLAAPAAWPGRAAGWLEPLGYLFGTPTLSALILGLAALGSATRARPKTILGLYVASYLLLHVVVTFHPWDRYLLPILPLICALAAQGGVTALHWLLSRTSERTRMNMADHRKPGASAPVRARPRPIRVILSGMAIALTAISVYATWLGAAGRIPVGSDYGAYRGVDRAAAALAALPADAVIYYRSLGWHLDFYLFDAPQERRWYDGAQKLATDAGRTARAEPARPQWLVLPSWETPSAEDLRVPLAVHGLRLIAGPQIALPDGPAAFTLYRLAPLTGEGL